MEITNNAGMEVSFKDFFSLLGKVFLVAAIIFAPFFFFAGCGGGGGGVPTISASANDEGTPSVMPASNEDADVDVDGVTVSYLSSSYWVDSSPDYYEGTPYDYGFQQVGAGDPVTVGVRANLRCNSGGYYCDGPEIPVVFRVYDGNTRVGPDVTILSDPSSVATASIPLDSLSVLSGSARQISIKAVVEDRNLIDTSYPAPETNMIVRIVPEDFVPIYSASTDQSVAVNVIAQSGAARAAAGGGYYSGGGYGNIRVKNTGNTAWWGFRDQKKRIYMVLDGATSSVFFSSSWYSSTVVSDINSYGGYVLPDNTTSLYFNLGAMNVPPGAYTECFKLQTAPSRVDTDYYKYELIDPVDIAGSHFCLDITVQPESLARVADSTTHDPVGKEYWASKGF